MKQKLAEVTVDGNVIWTLYMKSGKHLPATLRNISFTLASKGRGMNLKQYPRYGEVQE